MKTPQWFKSIRGAWRQRKLEARYKFQFESPVKVCPRVNLSKSSFVGRFSYIGDNSLIFGDIKIGRFCSIADGFVAIGQWAKGFLAIGQFVSGYFSIGQFVTARVAGIGQFVAAPLAIGQFAVAVAAIGQIGVVGTGIFQSAIMFFGGTGQKIWDIGSYLPTILG